VIRHSQVKIHFIALNYYKAAGFTDMAFDKRRSSQLPGLSHVFATMDNG